MQSMFMVIIDDEFNCALVEDEGSEHTCDGTLRYIVSERSADLAARRVNDLRKSKGCVIPRSYTVCSVIPDSCRVLADEGTASSDEFDVSQFCDMFDGGIEIQLA